MHSKRVNSTSTLFEMSQCATKSQGVVLQALSTDVPSLVLGPRNDDRPHTSCLNVVSVLSTTACEGYIYDNMDITLYMNLGKLQ